jgi:ERF superfamily
MSTAHQEVIPAATAPEATGMIAMMERLALNPDLPVDKLEKLLEMQLKIRAVEAKQSYAGAMARVQSKLPKIIRTKDNDQTGSKYAPLEVIVKMAAPIYTGEGFSISFSEAESPKPEHIRVKGIVRHADGHETEHWRDVAIDMTGIAGKVNKTMTHGEASSVTYGRRYVTCIAFNIPTEDDTDGNKPKKPVDLVNEAQLAHIEQLIADTKTELPQFLKWAKVAKLEEIPAKSYQTVVKQLEAKKGRAQK